MRAEACNCVGCPLIFDPSGLAVGGDTLQVQDFATVSGTMSLKNDQFKSIFAAGGGSKKAATANKPADGQPSKAKERAEKRKRYYLKKYV